MILNDLVEVAKRGGSDKVPLGCKEVATVCALLLSADGTFLGFGPTNEKGVTDWGPFIDPTMSGKPGLGIHKLAHVVAYTYPHPRTAKELDQAARAESKQAVTATFVTECSKRGDIAELTAVMRFLDNVVTDGDVGAEVRREIDARKINTALSVSVLVDGRRWFQDETVTQFWRTTGADLSDGWPERFKSAGRVSARKPSAKEGPSSGGAEYGQCLVCGNDGRLARLMPIALDGFRDKPKLVSFNRAAYTSRGQTQTYNAPICVECAELAPRGWNELISRSDSHFSVGSHRYVVWGELPLKPWSKPDPQTWLNFIASPWGHSPPVTAPTKFRLLGIGAHKTTAFIVAHVAKDRDAVASAVLRWARWQNLLKERQRDFFSIYDFAVALWPRSKRLEYRRKKIDLGSYDQSLCRDLFLLSVGEGPCPARVLPRLVDRLATEPEPLYEALDRLALLNVCLCSLYDKEEIDVDELGPGNRSAYNAGRIFSLVAYAQRLAIGSDTGKTIAGSNNRMASARPAAILPLLIARTRDIYLPKLRRDQLGRAIDIDKQLGQLVRDTVLSNAHTPEQMGWFWKGFYQSAVTGATTGEKEATK